MARDSNGFNLKELLEPLSHPVSSFPLGPEQICEPILGKSGSEKQILSTCLKLESGAPGLFLPYGT